MEIGNGTTTITSPSYTLSTNTWYHIAVSRSGTTTRMFLDGVQTGSSWTDTTNYTAVDYVCVGNNYPATIGWAGYIDDVRITKGVARYTSTFTVPSSEFPNYAASYPQAASTVSSFISDGTGWRTV